jgi:hypothetical protein
MIGHDTETTGHSQCRCGHARTPANRCKEAPLDFPLLEQELSSFLERLSVALAQARERFTALAASGPRANARRQTEPGVPSASLIPKSLITSLIAAFMRLGIHRIEIWCYADATVPKRLFALLPRISPDL